LLWLNDTESNDLPFVGGEVMSNMWWYWIAQFL